MGVTVTAQRDGYDFLHEGMLHTESAFRFDGVARAAKAAKVVRCELRDLKRDCQRMRREDAERHNFFPS